MRSVIFLLPLLGGCIPGVTLDKHIELAQKVCSPNGGVQSVAYYPTHLSVVCKNEVQIRVSNSDIEGLLNE